MECRAVLLAGGPSSVADALRSHGWEDEMANETAAGLSSAAFHISGIDTDTIEAMLSVSKKLGIQMISGPDWLILVGPYSRVGAFARPWLQPEPVRALATAVGMAMPAEAPTLWRHARGEFLLDAPILAGILNVTPDSFSDGGRFDTLDLAVQQAEYLLQSGAEIIDVGGESTRPGATPVSATDEMARVLPVIAAIVKKLPSAIIAIDTVKSEVAQAALDVGAAIVNDVTAGRHDPGILRVAAGYRAGMVLSHSRGPLASIATIAENSEAEDVMSNVIFDLHQSWNAAKEAGVVDDCVALDPGLGFGKGTSGNLQIVQQLEALVLSGRPVMVGPSRKRFVGAITGKAAEERDAGTAAICAIASERGATIFRVHQPAASIDAVRMGWGIRQGRKRS